MALSGAQRRFLRSRAHALRPVVIVGRNGLTEAVHAKVDAELRAHELIKVRFTEWKDQRRALAAALAERASAELAGSVGNVAILYRPADDPDERRIALPD